MKLLDDLTERLTRRLAARVSRRSTLTTLGRLVLGSAVLLPVLPIGRTPRRAAAAEGDPSLSCDYWKYCSVDGFLCSCCGGSSHQCPAGTEVSTVSWIGTCHNPADRKHYIVSYNDCCGKSACGRCFCNQNIGERPGYTMGLHNDVNWCMGNKDSVYHCTTSVVVGLSG
jgi:amicyanin-dependent methylamine dehydrogenase small subunit